MPDRNRVEPTQSLNLETSRVVDETLVKSAEPLSSESLRQADGNLPRQFGRYLIQKVLGRGGMGSVYLAQDTVLHRSCALKMPHFEKKRDREILDRFYREAQAAARVKHPNICDVYDVGEIDGVHFISMEYVAGRPLTDYISPSKPGRQRATAQLILKLATALEQAHKQQIVHRDLKPANIMIKENKQPVVMDFGLACSLETSDQSRMTTEGTILGSPAYMSPEQVLGRIKEVGPTSDVYSLGVIFFEMLAGRTPFQGSVNAVLGQIIAQDPPRLKELRSDIDPDLQSICLKMMAKQSAERYQSMHEIAQAISEWLRRVNVGEDGAETILGTAAPPRIVPQVSHEPAVTLDEPSRPLVMPPIAPLIDVDLKARTIVTAPGSRHQRTGRKSGTAWWWVAGLAGALLLGIVILLRDEHGVLRIEIDDDAIDVTIDGDQVRFNDQQGEMELTDGGHDLKILVAGEEVPIGESFALSTGELNGDYRVVVQLGDAELSGKRFTFNRNGQTALTVELVATGDPNFDANESTSTAGIADPNRPANLISPFSADEVEAAQQQWADYLRTNTVVENSLGMQLSLIPPGEFQMGSPREEEARENGEGVHTVIISQPFYVATCEVTQLDWRSLLGWNPSYFARGGFSAGYPVEQVTWCDAVDFCNALSRQENLPEFYELSRVRKADLHITHAVVTMLGGIGYRLPTEAEWEYACRAGTTTPFHFGSASTGRGSNVNGDIPYGSGNPWMNRGRTSLVGIDSPNNFGLFDMHGNVWEWCWDGFDDYAYRSRNSTTIDPVLNSPMDRRVVRGGSWADAAVFSRSANRHGNPPETIYYDIGFRVVRTVPPLQSAD